MKKEDINIFDLTRVLFGEVPPEFYIELILRTVIVFLVITFGMRLMGKRMVVQLNRGELAATSTLAAGTGLILLSPERGILPALLTIAVIMIIKKLVNRRNFLSRRWEELTTGRLSILVEDGVMQLRSMVQSRISKEQLFAHLRQQSIQHLGEVKRFYIETNGEFTLIKNNQPFDGLAVIPDWDKSFFMSDDYNDASKVCKDCGRLVIEPEAVCANCGAEKYVAAIRSGGND